MNTIRCPNCNELLPESASHDADCSKSMASPGHESIHSRISQVQNRQLEQEQSSRVKVSSHSVTLKLPALDFLDAEKEQAPSENMTDVEYQPLSSKYMASRLKTGPLPEEYRASKENGEVSEWQEIKRPPTWHKDVAQSPNRATAAPPPPRPAPSRVPMLKIHGARQRFRSPLFLWVSLLILLVVVFGGVFGVFVSLSQNANKTRHSNELSLQASPASVAIGATVMLSGTNFSVHGQVGFSRDTSIPIMDTSNTSTTEADGSGNFSDTITISPDWDPGPHTIRAEDAAKHKIASFPIVVSGHAIALRPAHLHISAGALDLGAGDQVTNTTKTITLTNVGGGQISWQSNSSQPWLLLSPSKGTFGSGHSAQITAAIDRSQLNPGTYKGKIDILSNAGNSALAINAAVTTLLPEHMAILQITPALLSFTATDGGDSPAAQEVTISNPGIQTLNWQATTSASWLSVSPQSTLIAPSGSTSVMIGVNSSNLLPGTYSGDVTFSAQGSMPVAGSPQSIEVTVTIAPQCYLQVSPAQLNFASAYQQPLPVGETIHIGTSQNCTTPIHWQAVSSADWLTINTNSGNTPSTPTIGINAANITPGTYHGSLTFSSATGTQTLPVSFTLGQAPISLIINAPDVMVFNGISGQTTSSSQRVSIANNGDSSAFTWKAQATTTTGDEWLSVSYNTGTLAAHQSTGLSITTTVLPSMLPGTYTGAITITAMDSVTQQSSGSPQVIKVILKVLPECALQAPSSNGETFTAQVGTNPAGQSFTIGVAATCTGNATITPTVQFASGSGWLVATPSTTTGGTTIFTVGVTSAQLPVGTYRATISLAAVSNGVTLANSPQTVNVFLNVTAPPSPVATPTPTPYPSSSPTPSPGSSSTPSPTSTPVTPTPGSTSTPG